MAVAERQARLSASARLQRYLRSWILWGMLVLGGQPLAGNPGLSREFQVKAVFLYNFVQFVDWPPDAFEHPGSPFVIGVLGLDPFGTFLDDLVRDEKVNGRAIVVKRFRHLGELDQCHVLFVSGSEGPRIEQIAGALRGRSILTVCDWDEFVRHGAMVRFVTERNRVRLRINLDAARASRLTISSKLLRSAETVTASRP